MVQAVVMVMVVLVGLVGVKVQPMIYIGIDPGASGAIAELEDHKPVKVWPMLTERDIWDVLPKDWPDAHAVIEDVHSMPGQGVVSSFKFGRSYGFLRGCLIAANIPFRAVTPSKWKGHFNLRRKKGETMTQYKNRSKALAQERFPDVKITHKTAEALLLALYCKETWQT